MPKDTQVNNLIVNRLTRAQYKALEEAGTVSNTELYIITDDNPDAAKWGSISGTLADQTDLKNALAAKANSSDLKTVATSGSYNDLTDKPTIPSQVTETTVSGWGFTKNTGTYSKPSTGIPKTDLASAVQTSLGKADTALQSVPDEYITESELENRLNILDTGLYYDPSGFTVVGTPTITDDGIASGFSSNNYLRCGGTFYGGARTFKIVMEIVTPEQGSETFSTVIANTSIRGVEFVMDRTSGNAFWFLSSDGASWDISSYGLARKLDYKTPYRIILEKTNTQYIATYINKFTNNIFTTKLDNANTINPNISDIIIGISRDFLARENWQDSIDLKQFSITVDGQQVFSGGKYLINDNNLDTTYIAKNADLQQVKSDLAVTDSIAKGAQQAVTFSNYQNAVTTINSYAYDKYNVGQNIMIETLDVPDLWVSAKFSDSQTYTYTTDNAIINALKTDGHIRVGRYQLSALETGKVDLTNYVKFTDYGSYSKAGVIKVSEYRGLSMSIDGYLVSSTKTLPEYSTIDNLLIGKGTLENIKEDLVARAIQSSTFGLDINLIEGAEQWL